MNAIIIDDERNAILTLTNDLRDYCPQVNVTATFTKALDALEYLKAHRPDVVFLDIDMPVMNGFDFIRTILTVTQGNCQFHIIFVSAYSEFAVKAFKVNAIDYLLKPIEPIELTNAVEKVANSKKQEQEQLLKNFVEYYHQPNSRKIVFPTGDGYHFIDIDDIIYFKADGAYTEVVMLDDKRIMISKTLSKVQELVFAPNFERIHQSYLINLNYIKNFKKGDSPSVQMANNDILKVSRQKKESLAMRLGIHKIKG